MVKGQSVFRGLIGHERPVGLLDREIGRPSHAYFFVGPSGVGKATVAARFAAALLCPAQGRHEEDCAVCRRTLGGGHPDLVRVEPEGKTMLTVAQARDTVAKATLAPVEADRKVFLFDEAGSMSEAAANAMLKTIEEPTSSTVFVLVAESEHDLPPTIASRCRVVQFGRVSNEVIGHALESAGVGPELAQETARISGGRPGLALALANRPEIAEFRRIWLSVPGRVTARPGDSFLLADEVLAGSDPLMEILEEKQKAELREHQDDGSTRSLEDRHERELRRQGRALMTSGLEILSSWYSDSAIAQSGGEIRNRDVPVTELVSITPRQAVASAEEVLDAIVALAANQRPRLVLASLFTRLGSKSY